MPKRICSLTILSLLLACLLAMSAFGARSAEEAQRIDPRIYKMQEYSFPDQGDYDYSQSSPVRETPLVSLGSARTSMSPGAKIGDTWYEYQRNGSMRRMIAWGTHGTPDTLVVHVNYMHSPDNTAAAPDRCYYYYSWNAAEGAEACQGRVQSLTTEEKAGYVVVAVTGDNRGIVGGHYSTEAGVDPYQTNPYIDFEPGGCFFTMYPIPLDTGFHCQATDATGADDGHVWPAIAYQDATDTSLPVFAPESDAGAQGLAYFRNVNPENGGVWMPRCVDTVNTLAQDIDCNDAGMVVIGWTAGLNCEGDPCNGGDTCSGHDCRGYSQWDNDLYYQASTDGGASWQNRVNVTKHQDECVAGNSDPYPYRPYTDVSVLITSDGEIHLAWAAMQWPSDANCGGEAGRYAGRIFHYCPSLCGIRTVHDANWDQTECSPNAWDLNACKMTISECDGKLYCLFAQFNDIPGGVEDDCAVASNPGAPGGQANADLWLTVSADWGVTWDAARNLTNTYTPACSLDCADESWSSMAKFGTNYSGNFSGANIVVPEDCTDPQTYYLDIMYIDDASSGGAIQTEGWWVNADVRWMRVPCCPPISNPNLILDPPEIGFPTWTKHGVQKDVPVICENSGNALLTVNSVTLTQTDGPGGSLGKAGDPTVIPSGCFNRDTMQVQVNVGGAVNNPGSIVYLAGYLTFSSTDPDSPHTLPIEAWITDTLIQPFWDTIRTSCTRLVVGSSGNFGRQGLDKYTMDYVVLGGDCDSNAVDYIYDGSPVIGFCTNGGTDTMVNFSCFSVGYVDTSGLVPIGDHTPTTDMGEYEVFETGVIVTHDSLIAIEKIWYAPKTHPDTCSFVIECIKIYLYDTLKPPPTSIYIGEAIDMDCPADTGARNHSGFDYPHQLIYQQGSEEDGEGCQPNDNRYGGMDFLMAYKNGVPYDSIAHGARTLDNATQIYPYDGYAEDSLYKYMSYSGFAISDSDNVDLNMIMTFDTLATLLPGDTYVFYIEIVTHMNGTLADLIEEVEQSKQFFEDYIRPPSTSCCKIRGDVDHSGGIDVGDLTYLVAYLFAGGPAPPCDIEGDVDGSGGIDVGDLTFLVAYLFAGGPNPPPCT